MRTSLRSHHEHNAFRIQRNPGPMQELLGLKPLSRKIAGLHDLQSGLKSVRIARTRPSEVDSPFSGLLLRYLLHPLLGRAQNPRNYLRELGKTLPDSLQLGGWRGFSLFE